MAHAKFFYFNHLVQDETEVTVASGGENPFYPVSNLKHPHALKTFRSSSSATAVIVYDFQTAVTFDSFLALAESVTGNLDLTAVTIEANATDSWGAPAFTTTVTDFDYEEGKASKFFTAQTYRYVRLTLVGTSGYVEVGKLFLGPAVQLESNSLAIGLEFGDDDLSQVSVGRYGQRFVDVITDQGELSGEFQLLTKDEAETMRTMFNYCGKTRPVWLMVDPDEGTWNNKYVMTGYFYFTKRPKFRNEFYGLYSAPIDLIEGK